MMMRAVGSLLFLLNVGLATQAWASSASGPTGFKSRPVLVFDLDRTLFDPTQRILAINRDVGREGTRAEFADPTKPHGYRFLLDPRYLALDEAIPGAAAALTQMQKKLDADIIYLTGRFKEMTQATIEQLRLGNFPGFGAQSRLRSRTTLYLRDRSEKVSTADYKVMRLARLAPHFKVVAIFDDSARNLQAFWDAGYRKETGTVLVRMTGLAPLKAGAPLPAWLCLNGFTAPEDVKKMEHWLRGAARCEQLLLGDLFD